MEQANTPHENEHVIDITSSHHTSSSLSPLEMSFSGIGLQHIEDQQSTSSRDLAYQSPLISASGSTYRNSSLIQRRNSRGVRRSPLNSGLWICIELVLTVGQIIAAVVTLSLTNNEKPRAPLKTWIVVYASGCLMILPHLYWRFKYLNQGSEQDSFQNSQDASLGNSSADSLNRRVIGGEDRQNTGTTSRGTQNVGIPSTRLKRFVAYYKLALDCFFAIWFVVGNVWIFRGHSSSAETPNLYWLCIVFLTFSCIGYAMPFILCAAICCCLPCIISVLGLREDMTQNRGASQESINSLPTYKFKKTNKSDKDKGYNSSSNEGGTVAAGTEKERAISRDDAVCSICLAKYMNNEELRELPCSHLFHKECIDKWLKINSTCPLCKTDVGEKVISRSLAEATASL